jgi:hypothetical protein
MKFPGILSRNKGVALYLALSLLMIAIVLANVILTIMLNQSRFSQHQIGRIQAYYAGMAGLNASMDHLRSNTWQYQDGVLNDCPPGTGCDFPYTDTQLIDPNAVNTAVTNVNIVFCPAGDNCSETGAGCNPPRAGIPFCIDTVVTYHTRETQ